MAGFNGGCLAGAFFLWASAAQAAPTTINGVTYDRGQTVATANAPATTNVSLGLKKIFLFPSLDDLSGVLAPKLDERLAQLFARSSRFDLVRDAQVVRALAPDDQAYGKAALSPLVHKEAARVTGADTTAILRTRNIGNETEMTLELRDAEGALLFAETGSIPGLSAMNVRWGLIDKLFQSIVAKIPFDGTVTGRSANLLTLDLGAAAIRPGEEIELARIVSVQRHPLLGTIVGTDYVRTGKARVTSADRNLSFAEVTEEFPGEMISAGAKVLRSRSSTVRRSEVEEKYSPERERRGDAGEKEEKDPFAERLKGDFDQAKPRYGQVGANLLYGSLSHSQTSTGLPAEYAGSGLGGNIEGELWVTKNWIATVYYGFHGANLTGGGTTVGDASWKRVEAFVGYRFFPSDVIGGLQFMGGLGYQMQQFTLPSPVGINLGGKKYAGPALKLDGEVSFLRDQKITLGFGFQPFSSFTDTGGSLGTPLSGTVIGFHLGWNYRIADLLWARLGFQFDTANGSYENNASVNDKRFAIGPGLYYSF